MRVRPIGDRVLVKPFTGEAKSPGGLIIPDAIFQQYMTGEVVEVGQGFMVESGDGDERPIIPLEVKVGDRVLFRPPTDAIEVSIDGVKHLIMVQADIAAVVEN